MKGFDMKKVIVIVLLGLVAFSGCATNNGPEYDGNSYNQIKRYEIGTVTSSRFVVIKDNGTGTFLGALIGAVLGSTVGRASGTTLAMLGGGLAGSYAGKEIGKANALELSVHLDSGDNIVVVTKGKDIRVGDRVKIIKEGNKVEQVYKVN
jgi:outer membrane lipoprotein SlyB